MTAKELKNYAGIYIPPEDGRITNPVLWRYQFKEYELKTFCKQLCKEQREIIANMGEHKIWSPRIILNAPMPEL